MGGGDIINLEQISRARKVLGDACRGVGLTTHLGIGKVDGSANSLDRLRAS